MPVVTSVHNTFEFDLETSLMAVLSAYLAANLDWASKIKVVQGEPTSESADQPRDPNRRKTLPRATVSTAAVEEDVYQSGIYRAQVHLMAEVDFDAMSSSKVRELFSAIVDCCQQTDLMYQLNAQNLVTVRLIVLGQARVEDFGDRSSQKTQELEIVGYSNLSRGLSWEFPLSWIFATGTISQIGYRELGGSPLEQETEAPVGWWSNGLGAYTAAASFEEAWGQLSALPPSVSSFYTVACDKPDLSAQFVFHRSSLSDPFVLTTGGVPDTFPIPPCGAIPGTYL